MLLEKTLHMSQPVAECKARLASIQSYRRQFLMVTRATVTSSKTVDFSFRGPFGFEAHTVLLSVDGDSPNQYAFESVGGNISLMGIVDFAEIRPQCTEVTLATDLTCKPVRPMVGETPAYHRPAFGLIDRSKGCPCGSARPSSHSFVRPW